MVGLELSGWALLLAGAAVAGWVDAVIGGGGLVLIPLILAVAPQLAPATALATNKLAAVSGTASAAVMMVRKVRPSVSVLAGYVPLALLCSGAGALAASLIDTAVMRPVIIVLMLAVGTFVALRPSFGTGEGSALPGGWRRWAVLALVGVIAFYDGIFGPGTGMFLIMAFTALLSQNFLVSAAMAKVVNTATNLGALVVFAAGGHVWWLLGLVLAVANILGAQLGARTVLGGGARFVRGALLVLVVVMSVYLGWQQLSGR
ncbi:permease [Corynebacterium halotolerans YIM 70093 = DSM 44683]|uniref:Probable membrane transporter protein n=1 Tax=Corynebacterium halotolerans YIM 70093 = DSM 44683 TaxID=1121362 RepID=M1NUN4_9CORY|nr:permease [Corynebacterium halotolerans YIM 70093 = DSM 44683]